MGSLAVVTGAGGALGRAYLDRFAQEPYIEPVGIVRSDVPEDGRRYLCADLLDPTAAREAIDALAIPSRDQILLVHAVGAFKFEERGPTVDQNRDGIDDEVYASNVTTFRNLAGPLLRAAEIAARRPGVALCCFGSVSDRYDVPFWRSYTAAKNELRRMLRALSESGLPVRGRMVNLSSTITERERSLRPLADTAYWLTPERIVDESFDAILRPSPAYLELDVYRPYPAWSPRTYTDIADVLARWKRDRGTEPTKDG